MVNPVTTNRSGGLSRRSFLRNAGVLAALTAGGSVLAGCSSSGPTQLRFYANKRETVPYYTKVANAFNASQSAYHANIENSTNLVADFVRNTPVQIGFTNYSIVVGGFVKRGVLADQTHNPVLQSLRPDTVSFGKQFGSYNNEVSCVPYSLAAAGVIYNRALFDKAGISSIPTTWTQFKTVCETLKSKGITPILGTWSGSDTWTMTQGIFDYVVGGMLPNVADFFAQLNAQGTDVGQGSPVSFSKNFAAPCQRMAELYQYHNSDRQNIGYDQGNRNFAAGQAAMYLQGPWAYTGVLAANPQFKGGMFPLPVTDNVQDTRAWVNLDQILFTPRSDTGAKRDGGLALMDYLMKPDVMHQYNSDNLAFSPDKAAPSQADPKIAEMDPYVKSGKYFQPPSYFIPGAVPLSRYLQAYLYGGSAADFLSQMDQDWKRLAVRLSA